MNTEFRKAPVTDSKIYPTVITASEKDKVVDSLLRKANGGSKATLEYRDIPDLEISKDQFELIIKQFKKNGLLENNSGYGSTYILTAEIHDKYRVGAFQMQESKMLAEIDLLIKEIDKLIEEKNADAITKLAKELAKRLRPVSDIMTILSTTRNLKDILAY